MGTKQIKIELTTGALHKYQMGPGPCGRTVTELHMTQDKRGILVVQYVEGVAAAAEFFYPWRAIIRVAEYPYLDLPLACALPIDTHAQ